MSSDALIQRTWIPGRQRFFDHPKRLELQEEAVGVVDYPRPVRTLSGFGSLIGFSVQFKEKSNFGGEELGYVS